MTLQQLRYVAMVAEKGTMTEAATELYISQPSLSRSMASLENELGVTLFEKEGRGVTLTKAGRMFLEYADRILTDCHIAVGKMREISMNGGKIDIGYVFPLAGHYIPHRVKLFLEQPENQKVVFNFWQNHTPAIAKKVKTGELDVGFGGCLEKDDMEFFPVAHPRALCEIQHPAGHHCGVSGRIFDRRTGAGEFWHRTDAAHGHSGAFSGSLHSPD